MIACQPSLVKEEKQAQQVDSTLFFKQLNIDDPFFEKIDQLKKQKITLKKTVVPPQPIVEESLFKEIDGYRVQIFAGLDSLNALTSKHKAKSLSNDTIYTLVEKGLHKLQVGDYPYYPQADSVKKIFRSNRFPGAWIVQRTILIPITGVEQDSIKNESVPPENGEYKIQIIATGDEKKANDIVSDLMKEMQVNAFYEKSGNIFKVFVGFYNEEKVAREMLNKIRDYKYPEAWLVY